MDSVINQIDCLVISKEEQLENNKLKEKYKNVTHVQALLGFYKGMAFSVLFIQFFSVVLGIGLPLLLADKMPKVAPIVFALGLIVLIFLEYSKGWVMKKINVIRIVNKQKAIPVPMGRYFLAAVFLTAWNVAIGYWSSPLIVETLVSVKGIEPIAEIDSTYTAKKQAETIRFEALKAGFAAKALELKTSTTKANGLLKSAAVKPVTLMENRAASATDSLTSVLSFLDKDHFRRVVVAEGRNAQTLKNHLEWCNSFGWVVAIIALILEVCLIILAYWLAEFDQKKIVDIESRVELAEAEREAERLEVLRLKASNATIEPQKVEEKEKEKENAKVTENQELKPNDFVHNDDKGEGKEGDIIKGVGKKKDRVLVIVSGVLVPKLESELTALIKVQTTAKRIQHLESLKKLLA
jgi:hypothetical protein